MKAILLLTFLASTTLACVTRADAVNRAMEWVNAHVPYDASKYRSGYVQGCQGIVGYAWQFPTPGIPAGHLLGPYCRQVTKNDMEMADIMTNPEAHQLLFHSWSKADKSEYWAIQLGGSKGSIKYTIPWPYWSGYNPEKYIPCKVLKACMTEDHENKNLQVEQ